FSRALLLGRKDVGLTAFLGLRLRILFRPRRTPRVPMPALARALRCREPAPRRFSGFSDRYRPWSGLFPRLGHQDLQTLSRFMHMPGYGRFRTPHGLGRRRVRQAFAIDKGDGITLFRRQLPDGAPKRLGSIFGIWRTFAVDL